jgi:predicted ATPase
LRESGTESRFEALRAIRIPLVGRDEELALLQRRWQQAKSGAGCVVVVSGEPGIGKSRLAQTLIGRLAGQPHTRLRAFCSPHHLDSALYPTITQLERAAGFRREDTADERVDKLEALLAKASNDLGDVTQLLATLLSLTTGDRYPPLGLTPQKQKERTLQALVAQVEGLAALKPVLMLFEDAQWSDPTSLELLDLIIDRVPALRVLLIITFRAEFAPPWIGRPHVTALALNRLGEREGSALVEQLAGNAGVSSELIAEIVERSDGVPLFIEELAKAVVEAGTERGALMESGAPASSLAVPSTLHASLLGRLDRLGRTAKLVAQAGAAIGRDFSYDLVAAAAELAEPELQDALRRLVESGLVFQRGVPPASEYLFKHALVQDTAYSTLLRGPRQALHRRIALALEAQFPSVLETRPELAAHHYGEAAMADKAVRYWLLAGKLSVARSAVAEAIAQLRRGLAFCAACRRRLSEAGSNSTSTSL